MGTDLLVLDEPVAQLDPAGASAVADLLGDLAADGTAVLAAERVTAFLATMDRVSALPVAAGASSSDPPTRPWLPVRQRPSATVELDHVSHRYAGGVEALRDASLTAEPGETVAIVGRNGSGKTTLVKHLIGLLQPSAGEIRIDGRSIAGRPIHAIAGTVGFVFQRPEDQLFERTVEREVGFGPRMLGFDAGLVRRLVDNALGATGLTGQRATNPYDLGLAGRRLVALASALAMDPAIVVLDEPTAGQDPAGVARTADLVRALAADDRTVVAITHDLAFAAEAFVRVVVMRDGSIVDDGPPGRVLGAGNEALLASTGLAPGQAPGPGVPRPWPRTTSRRIDVSMTSTPAMTAATSNGSGWPSIQPAAAAKAATARNARRTARMSPGTSSRPASAIRLTDLATRTRPSATDPPTSAARTTGSGVTMASSRSGRAPRTVAPRIAARPPASEGQDRRRPGGRRLAHDPSTTSWTRAVDDPPGPHARLAGRRVGLVVAERTRGGTAHRGRRPGRCRSGMARPGCGCASGRCPR